jgi:hypothetical protein
VEGTISVKIQPMGMQQRPNLKRPRSRTHVVTGLTSKKPQPQDSPKTLGGNITPDEVIANNPSLGSPHVIRRLAHRHSNPPSMDTDPLSRKGRIFPLADSPLLPKPPYSIISPAKKVILLGGQQLEIIKSSQFLRQHFCLLLYTYGGLICYNFSALNKHSIVKYLQRGPKNYNRVLAIGDGLNDVLMMDAADVSIKVIPKKKSEFLGMDYSDFLVKTFYPVNDFMFCHMPNLNYNFVSFMGHLVFKQTLMVL